MEEKPKVNLDQVIENIQVELVEPIELVVPIIEVRELVVVAIETFQLAQPIVEPIHPKSP